MRLQVALDTDWDSASRTLTSVQKYVDIVEIGTPLVFLEGLSIVEDVRRRYPELTVLADLKIIDAGEFEATLAFQAGVDIVTVLGVAPDQTILGVLEAARKYNKQVLVDMMQVQEILPRSRWLVEQGADYICVHLAHDLQVGGILPLASLMYLRENLPQAQLAVAGGINLKTIDLLKPLSPEIVIVGKAITLAPDPRAIANKIRKTLWDE